MTSEGLKRRSFLSLIFITKIFTKGTSRDALKSFAFGCQCQNYDETESGTWKHFFNEVAFAVAVVVFLDSRSPQPRKQSLFLLTTGWETSDPGKSLLEDRAQESIIDQVYRRPTTSGIRLNCACLADEHVVRSYRWYFPFGSFRKVAGNSFYLTKEVLLILFSIPFCSSYHYEICVEMKETS